MKNSQTGSNGMTEVWRESGRGSEFGARELIRGWQCFVAQLFICFLLTAVSELFGCSEGTDFRSHRRFLNERVLLAPKLKSSKQN